LPSLAGQEARCRFDVAGRAQAFRYFTADFGIWWPAATHSVVAYANEFKDIPAAIIFEPRIGGRIFERPRSGHEHLWGSVLVWQPPVRVQFSFHPGRDEKEAQTVEITFSSVPEGARVVLTHSGWEKLSANAQKARDSYDQGWETVFRYCLRMLIALLIGYGVPLSFPGTFVVIRRKTNSRNKLSAEYAPSVVEPRRNVPLALRSLLGR
jgi:hypothetical protein